MLSSQNGAKIYTATYLKAKADGERDSSNLIAAQIAFLDIRDGQGDQKDRITNIMSDPLDPVDYQSKPINLEKDYNALQYGH